MGHSAPGAIEGSHAAAANQYHTALHIDKGGATADKVPSGPLRGRGTTKHRGNGWRRSLRPLQEAGGGEAGGHHTKGGGGERAGRYRKRAAGIIEGAASWPLQSQCTGGRMPQNIIFMWNR
jgi:hypothetical protein